MTLLLHGNSYRFEMENICRLFLPGEKIGDKDTARTGVIAQTYLDKTETGSKVTCTLQLDDFFESLSAMSTEDDELVMATLLYRLFTQLFGYTQQWGIVTGVRPVKLFRKLAAESGQPAALRYFQEQLLVSEEKCQILQTTWENENKILSLSRPDSFSLYISIPFCPTRCDYCSFVSQTVEKAAKLIPTYVTLLAREIAYTGEIAKRLGLRLETVYFGGGTPTTLTSEQLAFLLKTVEDSFDLSALREYTVEAGRPDTVTPEKLAALKAAGVTRISINPQTLQDTVLASIGRRHTVRDFFTAYESACRCGFDNINTDLIAGLPGDTYEGFCASLEGICDLSPQSVTVHALSMKRASNLVIQRRADYRVQKEAIRMVTTASEQLPAAGYLPYYLYRQSRAAGNQENVGWAKPGREGLYNVYIMDETHTILACGAGAVTKLKRPGTEYLERIFNYKFPYEYNAGIAEMMDRKAKIEQFYLTERVVHEETTKKTHFDTGRHQ